MTTSPLSRLFLTLILAGLLAGCTTPAPPRPAMQPLTAAGNFGFSDRKIDDDTIEVTYQGAEIEVNSRDARNDARLAAEKLKVRDLALLRGVRLADDQGAAAVKIVSERIDSDVDVRSRPSCRPSPFWGPPGFWGYRGYPGYGPGYGYRGYGWPGPYDCHESRWARARATAVLILDLLPLGSPAGEGTQPVSATLERLEKDYVGATYP